MKKRTSIIACLCATGLVWAQPKPDVRKLEFKKLDIEKILAEAQTNTRKNYDILVPPWMMSYTHAQARTDMLNWSTTPPQNKLFMESPLVFTMEFDHPKTGGNGFLAKLNAAQVKALRAQFSDFFIDDTKTFVPVKNVGGGGGAQNNQGDQAKRMAAPPEDAPDPKKAIPQPKKEKDEEITKKKVSLPNETHREDEGHEHGVMAGTPLQTTWAAKSAVPSPITVTRDSPNHTPVLYVVDTGVQPLVKTGATTYMMHPEFNQTRVKFHNGRVPATVGNWAPSSGTWSNVDGLFTTYPSSPFSGTGYVDPQVDLLPHGTRVASTAIGATVGLLSKVVGPSVEVESIRIYTTNTTLSTQAADGIFEAIDAHYARNTSWGARSVLVFASRSDANFSQSVEVALWWAWKKGMIVICAGGDVNPGTYAPGLASPDSIWFTAPNTLPASPQPTSPSRFDIAASNANPPNFWPQCTDPISGNTITRPDANYMVLVGGNKVTYANVNTGGTTQTTGENTWAIASSQGPDIDLIVPCDLVPCATNAVASAHSTNDCLADISGTSLSAGFVAGVALVYLDHYAATKTPADFRSWLLTQPGTGKPLKTTNSSTAAPWQLSPYQYNTTFGNAVPKLQIDGAAVFN